MSNAVISSKVATLIDVLGVGDARGLVDYVKNASANGNLLISHSRDSATGRDVINFSVDHGPGERYPIAEIYQDAPWHLVGPDPANPDHYPNSRED